MAASAFSTELARSVRATAGRFLAIAGIAALGCGFYAGLRMCGPSMRTASDAYYDGTALDDIRVVSTLGLDGKQVDAVKRIEGVDQVMPVRSVDAMATLNDEQYAMRITSFDCDAARASAVADHGAAVVSDADAYLDRIVLAKGSWPSEAGECLISADRVMGTPIQLGDTVEVLYGTSDLDGVLEVRTFTVSGLVHASAYVSSVGLGYTSLGSGIIQQYLYVLPEAFDEDLPYTQLLIAVEGARGELSGSEAYQGVVDAVRERLEDAADDLAESRLATVRSEAQEQIDDAQAEYDDAKAEADAAALELEQGQRDLDEQRSAWEAQKAAMLASGRYSPDALGPLFAQTEEQLATAQEDLDAHASELAEALEELADAQAEIDDAQREVDELEPGEIYVTDRTQLNGPASYQDDSERIDHIAAVFPLIFFLVAALVALTTMTRMVEDERQEIGTHKALGFSTRAITSKYLAYAAIASGTGAVIGILALTQVLPYVVMKAYAIMYSVPFRPFPLAVDPAIALSSLVAGCGITLFATWAAAAATLRETPADLMLPRAPKPGKRILLERIKPLWNRTSFSWKVSFRNLFRYKRRLAMTVIGIAGCTGLLLTGLGLHDSIWDIIAVQFEGPDPITAYNTVVGLEDGAGDAGRDAVAGILEDEGGADKVMFVEQRNMRAASAAHPGSLGLTVQVVDDYERFGDFVSLRGRTTGERIGLGPESVVLTEKMARWLGVGAGDTLLLYEQDDIGNAQGAAHAFTVSAVAENYIYHYCYIGAEAWEDGFGEAAEPNAALAKAGHEDSALAQALHDADEVRTVTFNTETIENYRKSLRSVNMIVVVLVAAAAALAFIVLYNLTNINIIERTREIASLKVLGFEPREVAAYVFRETFMLVVGGALGGLGFGTVLVTFVIQAAEVDAVMFGRSVHTPSYLWAFLLTVAFSALVMLAMLPKLKRIDMVESLKSVD